MVNVFFCGVGGAGKTTLAEKLLTEKAFKDHAHIEEVARNLMKKTGITKAMLESSEETFLRLQEMIITGQRAAEEKHRRRSVVSDRAVLDSLAYILVRKDEEYLEEVVRKHQEKISSSVSLYLSSLVVLVLPWAPETPEDGTRLSSTQEQGETYTSCLRRVMERFNIGFLELREPDLERRVQIVLEAVKGKVPLNNWSLDYYQKLSDRDKRSRREGDGLFPHNINFFLDLGENSGIRMIEMFEDHLELREGGYRQFREEAGRASTSCTRFVKRFGVERLVCLKFDQRVRPEEVQRLLLPGVRVGGQLYTFLGCSQGGLKERSGLLWRGDRGEVARVLAECGDLHKITSVSKRMAREGLLFSSVELSGVKVEEGDIIPGEDIERCGYNFTDGCGEISQELVERVVETLPSTMVPPGYLPSVLQIRLQGIKGVVALNPRVEQGKMMVRPSQKKFHTTFEPTLGVAGVSRPYSFGHLNRQFVILLSGLGVQDQVFLSLHQEYYDLVERMTRDKEAAITILQWRNQWQTCQQLVKISSLELSQVRSSKDEVYRAANPMVLVRKRLREVQQAILKADTKEGRDGAVKEKLRMLVPHSRLVYGVCDQEGELSPGQCQVRLTTEGGLVRSLLGKVVVARSPSYLLGDVRVLQMVHAKGLEHLGEAIELLCLIPFP